MNRDFPFKRIQVPQKALKSLSHQDRHAFYLLGHIYNEIMFLYKQALMCIYGLAENEDSVAVGAGASFSRMFVLRMLAGKVHEAGLAMKQREVGDFLRVHCFPHVKGIEADRMLREIRRRIDECRWLNQARNGHAFHYPEFNQTAKAIEALAKGKADYEVIMGGTYGETLYRTSDVMAGVAFASEANPDDYKVAIESMDEELIELSRLMTKLITESLNAFILHLFYRKPTEAAAKVKIKDVAVFEMPKIDDCRLPYFVKMPLPSRD